MKVTSLMNTTACTAQPRSGLSDTMGMPESFRIGDYDAAPGAMGRSCGTAGIGDQRKGGRVFASGEDV